MANEKTQERQKVVTPEFRVSWPAVFTPKAPMEGSTGKSKYGVTMIFPKTTDITPLKQIVVAAMIEKWGADKTKWPTKVVDGKTISALRIPFRDGSEKDHDGYGPTVVFANATTVLKPGLVGPDRQPILDPSEFYGGCYARATVHAWAYDKAGNKGVSLSLHNVQKTRDGEPFSGNGPAENDFDAITPPAGAKTAVGAKGASVDDMLGGIGA